MSLTLLPFVVPTLLSALTLGGYDIAKKQSLAGNAVLTVLFSTTACGTIFFILLLAGRGELAMAWNCSAKEYALIWIKSAIVTASWACEFYALRELPLSLYSPIRASAPLWTLLGGILLFAELPTVQQGFGMALVLIGYVGFFCFGKQEGFAPTGRAMVLATIGTLLGAGSALFDKVVLNLVQIPPDRVQLYFGLDCFILMGAMALFAKFAKNGGTKFRWRWSIPLAGILIIGADYFYFRAVSLPEAQISLISLLRRTSCLVPFVFGATFGHEVHIKRKSLALVFILGGAALIALARKIAA